jgi:hypothetical protein
MATDLKPTSDAQANVRIMAPGKLEDPEIDVKVKGEWVDITASVSSYRIEHRAGALPTVVLTMVPESRYEIVGTLADGQVREKGED